MKPVGPFTTRVASDVVRDGLGVELLDERGHVVAEVFRCDADHSVIVATFDNDIPLAAMTELMSRAREQLDPFEDGTPLDLGTRGGHPVRPRRATHALTYDSPMARRKRRPPDCEAEVVFLATEDGGRRGPARSGYRPAHPVLPDYLTTGEHEYLGREWVQPGESALTHIWFITPEVYPGCLFVGRELAVQEASRRVATATITAVFNPILDRDA